MNAGKRLMMLIIGTVSMVAVMASGQESSEESKLIFRAGSTDFRRHDDGTYVKRYYNHVEAWTRDRDSDVSADAARYDSGLGETRFYGSAAFRDSARILQADTLIYFDNTEQVLAIGNVAVSEKDRTFWANRVSYDKPARIVHAIGDVIVRDDSLQASMTGNEAVFNDSTGYGLISEYPVLVKEDEDGNIITLSGSDTLEVIRDQDLVRIWNNVEIVKDSLRAESDYLVYDDSLEVLTMTGQPSAEHVMYDIESDAVSKLRAESKVYGDTIRIRLVEQEIREVSVIGSALNETVWEDTTGGIYARSVLQSNDMRLEIEENVITTIVAEGMAKSYYFRNPADMENAFVNEATGDTLQFIFDNGRMVRLRISGVGGGGAKGKYYEFSEAEPETNVEQEQSEELHE